MNDFLLLTISIGFGSLAWGMLAVSDWLLGDKPKRPAALRTFLPAVDRGSFEMSSARGANSRGFVPAARRAS